MTRSRWTAWFCAWATIALAASGVRAAFEDPQWSARVAALGGAFTAVGDDPGAAFYNPAAAAAGSLPGSPDGAPSLERPAVQFSYARLFTGVQDVDLALNELSYVHPLPGNNLLSLGWGSLSAQSLRREDNLVLGGAHRFDEVPWVGQASVGLSLRWLSQTYTLDSRSSGDPVFTDGRSKSDIALDLHGHVPVLAMVSPGLSAGISVRSINQPDVGFATEEKLPIETSLGVLYRWDRYRIPLDLEFRAGELTPQIGFEALLSRDRLALRAGTDTHQVGAGAGYLWKLGDRLSLALDYAFLWPLELEDTSGSHRATVGLRF